MTATASVRPAAAAPERPAHPLAAEGAGLGVALVLALLAVAHLCLTPRAWLLFSDADSVLLPLIRASQQVGEPQRWAMSSVLFLPEQALYDATAALGLGVRGSLAVDGVVNLVLLYVCFRLVAGLAGAGPRMHRIAGALIATAAFVGFTLLDSSAAWDSLELPSLLATTTYYSATVLASVVAVGLATRVLLGRAPRASAALAALTAFSVLTNPLFIAWAGVPLALTAALLVVLRRLTLRRAAALGILLTVGTAVGLLARLPFATEIARSAAAYADPAAALPTLAYLVHTLLARDSTPDGLVSIAGILTIVLFEAVLAARLLRRGEVRAAVPVLVGVLTPVAVVVGSVLLGAAGTRYLQPVFFAPLTPLVLLRPPRRVVAVLRRRVVRPALAGVLVVAGVAGAGVTAATAATPDASVTCLDTWITAAGRAGGGLFETIRGPKSLLADPRLLVQVDSRLRAQEWLTDRADYTTRRLSFLVADSATPAFAVGRAGPPRRTILCGRYRIEDWETPVLTVAAGGPITPPHPPSTTEGRLGEP